MKSLRNYTLVVFFLMMLPSPKSSFFPYKTLFRSVGIFFSFLDISFLDILAPEPSTETPRQLRSCYRTNLDRKSVVQGKIVDLGGRRIIKKKRRKKRLILCHCSVISW